MVKRLAMYGGILIVLCLSFVFVSAAPQAHAASLAPQTSPALCSGHGCDHTDPYASNIRCAGYSGDSWSVVRTAYIYVNSDPHEAQIGYVQLWWSATCQTNWARTVCTASSCNSVNASLDISGNTCSGQSDICYVYSTSDVRTHQMYLPTTQAWACGGIASGGGAVQGTACTSPA